MNLNKKKIIFTSRALVECHLKRTLTDLNSKGIMLLLF